MNYKVVTATKVGEITTANGSFAKYIIMFEGQVNGAEMLQKPETPAPQPGQVMEGELKNDEKWGLKFKKAQSGGGFGRSNPETNRQIIRQNALTNAVSYCVAKSRMYLENSEPKKAFEELTGKHVVEVADFFRKFSEGEETVVTVNRVVTANDESPHPAEMDIADIKFEDL